MPAPGVEVLLHGLPEKIGHLTAILDRTFPGLFDWTDAAPAPDKKSIVLRGVTTNQIADDTVLNAAE